MDLTDRQKKLLRAVIEKYIETAEPVGSETIEKEAGLGVSPATIRNEMVRLTALGYLKQPHTSAGRVPTSMGMKFFVDQLMEEKSLSLKDEVAIKEELQEENQPFDKLLKHTARVLADQTHSLALATNEDNDIYAAGMANILDMPEFYDIDITKTVLSLLDKVEMLSQILGQLSPEEQTKILFGEELGVQYLEPCGFVVTRYQMPNHRGVLAVIGPSRLNYPVVIPTMRYFSQILSNYIVI
ncbi:hypothetical protein A2870_04665 [Candidatus Curtissbacteria bacterium RIFCSPHIGHO2_01_FULL_41_11]|uniref:Heat-inducible transcription repressor HrcA n=1 Tax=Candidatus Curtissbacteria bacterium RIFCSPHIGHO2_01_FULL_41_11 TaxID=1797711 RepID=A0A1F5G778_9BACT|nr:MAG: hypothetical protein A2870_04665 [Candidatus Curtissbacteria bacterium RIFCSPHIGHO2_01_FULL_41_11]